MEGTATRLDRQPFAIHGELLPFDLLAVLPIVSFGRVLTRPPDLAFRSAIAQIALRRETGRACGFATSGGDNTRLP